ncbi:MAG TPA: Holliday junction branch migration DNA helicase RuvB [Dongiaceae bacterium]|nr:Holliday junction branch migration DNA helicase RuvB [Dongiaceae bacterium]
MAIERLVDTGTHDEDTDEQRIEVTLRPQTFNEYVGQERLKVNLQLAITAAKKRAEPLDHILLYGPPGLGKTTMATVIAHEMGSNIRVTAGPAIERAADLASILTSLEDGDILFIDEIHRLSRSVEEVLYAAMEDYKLDIMIGKGPGARSVRLDLPKFTIIGATTRTGALAAPLRDRFGHIYRLEFYAPEEIGSIIARAASILGTRIDASAASLLSTRARLTPRIANRLLKRVRDYADVNGDGIIDTPITQKALELLEIDALGLDAGDRNLLLRMTELYGTNPVGLTTLAALTGDEANTIEDFYEPYLLQIGLIERTPRGRRATPRAFTHLGKKNPDSNQEKTTIKED